MTFDDQLKQAFDGMGERLRAAVDHQVESVVEEIGAAAQAERERAVSRARDEAADALETAVVAARQEAREEGLAAGKDQAYNEGLQEGRLQGGEEGRQLGIEDGRRQGLEEGRQQGLAEGRQLGLVEGRQQGLEEGLQGVLEARRAVEQEGRETLQAAVAAARAERVVNPGDTEMLAESVRTIGGARSLKEVLETLVDGASRQSGHANVWVIQGGRLRHWRPNGIDEGEPSMALDAPGAIAAAARTNTVATSDGTLAVPIAMAGQAVAVLYTNAGAHGGAIEILARYAARCLEALTAFKAARALTERPGEPNVKAPALT